MREELEERGKGLTNPPVFRFLKTEELVHWYSAGSLCVHASEVEVECMSVLEAMACGLPCLIADSSTERHTTVRAVGGVPLRVGVARGPGEEAESAH